MRKTVLFAACLGLVAAAAFAFPALTSAQRSGPPPESYQEMMPPMGPMMGGMMQEMTASWLELIAKPETAEKLASFTKNYYDALRAKGFSKDEALKIVTAAGAPALPR